MRFDRHLEEWKAAGLIDFATAESIAAFEAGRPEAGERAGVGAAEVVAYIGSVVLLVGLGFLYGTEYQSLGTAGRLTLIALVVAIGFGAGELLRRIGGGAAARRARAAGWAVAALGVGAWFAQAFVDASFLTKAASVPGEAPDASGAVMAAAIIGFAVAAVLLWRSGAALVALALAILANIAAVAFDSYYLSDGSPWASEGAMLVAGGALLVAAETLTRGLERRWACELLRAVAVVPPVVAALGFSGRPGADWLEWVGGAIAVAAFGLAVGRRSAGAAIGAGIALFIVVTEVGVRHFAQSVGFPVVLLISGVALIAIAAAMFRVLPRLTRRGGSAPG